MFKDQGQRRFTAARLLVTGIITASFLTLAVIGADAARLSVFDSVKEFFGLRSLEISRAEGSMKESDRSLVSTTFVISHAYGGGGGTTGTYLNDYVELKNISSSPQSLAGLSLMYGSATGQFASFATNAYALTGGTVQPGQYYLIQLSNAGTMGAPLPVAPDETTTNLSMSGTNGKVALVTSALLPNTCGATATPCTLPNAAIIDLVAWGTANNAEGGASTNAGASLTSVQGNVRNNNGCQDTDNNNADFTIITAPVPRNTATTTACGAVGTPTFTATASPSPTNTFTSTPTNTPTSTSTGTPAASPTPPQGGTLVLSQVAGGGGGSTGTYLNDYVEIKNISAAPRSLNGLSLYYGSALGNFASTATNAFVLPDVTLNPGQYYLVQLGMVGTVGLPLPAPDVTTTNLNMSGTNGKVALVTAGLAQNICGATATPCDATQLPFIVDWVAYGAAGNGAAGNGEGGTSVNNGAPLTPTQGGVRKNNGCQDTNNNNLDFDVVTAPVPRNSASPAAPCSVTTGTPTATFTSTPTGTATSTNTPTSTPTGSPSPRPAARADFDGDGRSDLSVFRPSEGNWYLNRSTAGLFGINFGLNGDLPIPGDYDGDGKTDVAVFRGDPTGQNPNHFILNSSNNTVSYAYWGLSTDTPLSGDYDGDRKTDISVYRASNNTWYIQQSGGGTQAFNFGAAGDLPMFMDYEGDGKSNIAVFRPSNGTWYIARPTGVPAQNFVAVQFGTNGDMPVPADYDGDRKDDIAVFRPSIGTWYAIFSTTGGAVGQQFGQNGDIPVPADYDGDFRADLAVYRGGIWYFDLTASGFSATNYGLPTDIPIPKRYIP